MKRQRLCRCGDDLFGTKVEHQLGGDAAQSQQRIVECCGANNVAVVLDDNGHAGGTRVKDFFHTLRMSRCFAGALSKTVQLKGLEKIQFANPGEWKIRGPELLRHESRGLEAATLVRET